LTPLLLYVGYILGLPRPLQRMQTVQMNKEGPTQRGDRIQINVTVHPTVFAKIEKVRGRVPRSVFVSDILVEYFKHQEGSKK